MSLRFRAIALGVGFVVLVVAWFFLFFRPNQARIDEIRAEQEVVQQDITRLQAELARLQELQRQEPQLRAELARLQDALPSEPRLPDFILQVQDAANLAGIDFLSITPSLPADLAADAAPTAGAGSLQAISVSISIEGSFFEIEDFLIRMERLSRAVKISAFTLSPRDLGTPGASPTLSTVLQMQMFMLSTAGVPATPPPPAPAPTPAPAPDATAPPTGEVPVPTPAPTPEAA